MNENEIETQNEAIQKEVTNNKNGKSFWLGILIGILFSTLVCAVAVKIIQEDVSTNLTGVSTSEATYESVVNEETEAKVETIENIIQQLYWEDIDEETLETGIYRGLMDSLDDPYSVYYTPEELEELLQDTEGIYYGIGAYITTNLTAGYVQVSKLIKNTPAAESGLEPGDYIYMVDGEDMYEKESAYVVSKIKGEEGSYVTITVMRDGVDEPIDISVMRAKIESPTVEYEMYDNGVAYIQISEFDDVTTSQFEEAYLEAINAGMKGLILDLRSNPGGNLQTVVDIASDLLPEGLIVYTEDKYGKRTEYTCDGTNEIQVPLVCLVNGYSASASEILSGAIKDYGIGTLMGTTTYGKGIVQKIVSLSDGSAVKLTISRYFTPNGNYIHKVGIEPDIEVEYDADAYKEGIDNQLEAAKEYITEQIK